MTEKSQPPKDLDAKCIELAARDPKRGMTIYDMALKLELEYEPVQSAVMALCEKGELYRRPNGWIVTKAHFAAREAREAEARKTAPHPPVAKKAVEVPVASRAAAKAEKERRDARRKVAQDKKG